MQSALDSSMGLPSNSTNVSRMVWLTRPLDVRRIFMLPPGGGTAGKGSSYRLADRRKLIDSRFFGTCFFRPFGHWQIRRARGMVNQRRRVAYPLCPVCAVPIRWVGAWFAQSQAPTRPPKRPARLRIPTQLRTGTDEAPISGASLIRGYGVFPGVAVMGATGLEPVTPSLSSWCSPN